MAALSRHTAIITAAVAMLATARPAAASSAPGELEIKAAFLPRFSRHVTWPLVARPGPSSPLVLCTIGSDPFGPRLEQSVSSQSVDGHRIVVRRIQTSVNVRGCHIAFVGGSSDQPTGQILAAIGRQPILTVTDARTGSQRGIIHFASVSGRVRFFIDEAAAAQRGLSISSRLLDLAVAVRAR